MEKNFVSTRITIDAAIVALIFTLTQFFSTEAPVSILTPEFTLKILNTILFKFALITFGLDILFLAFLSSTVSKENKFAELAERFVFDIGVISIFQFLTITLGLQVMGAILGLLRLPQPIIIIAFIITMIMLFIPFIKAWKQISEKAQFLLKA